MHISDQPKGVTRRIELDFLRGIAILLVMGAHFRAPVSGVEVLDWITHTIKMVGGVGVNLFFSLSGFLVGGLLLKELKSTGEVNASRFLIRRALKIWPALYFLLLVHFLIGHHPSESYLWQNIFHVQNYFGTSIKQTWSLAVEEHFYLFLAFFISFQAKSSPKKLLINLLIIAFISVILRWVAVHYGYLDDAFRQTQYRMDSLLFGVILSVIYIFYRETFDRIATYRFLLFISFTTLVTTIWLTASDPVLDRNIGYLVQAVGFSILILQVFTSTSSVKSNFAYRFVAWVGIYSYGIYLWHTVSLQPAEKLAKIALGYGVDSANIWILVMCFQLVVSLILGYITTLMVEWPFLKLRERFYPPTKTFNVV
jgi:peptidoglycan/LPS O-acetylase OafA/YrhL